MAEVSDGPRPRTSTIAPSRWGSAIQLHGCLKRVIGWHVVLSTAAVSFGCMLHRCAVSEHATAYHRKTPAQPLSFPLS